MSDSEIQLTKKKQGRPKKILGSVNKKVKFDPEMINEFVSNPLGSATEKPEENNLAEEDVKFFKFGTIKSANPEKPISNDLAPTVEKPSATNFNMDLGKAMAEAESKRTQKALKNEDFTKFEKNFNKTVNESEETKFERTKLIHKLEDYAKKYQKKINFNFKSTKQLNSFSLGELKAEHDTVTTLVNSQGAPEVVKMFATKICELIEYAAAVSGNRFVDLHDFSKDVKQNMETDFFDPEVEQIVIEYSHLFAVSPVKRMIYKIGNIAVQRLEKNGSLGPFSGGHFKQDIHNDL